jgi:hypothetical protein
LEDYSVNEALLHFLELLDRSGHLDIASEVLAAAVNHLLAGDGFVPPDIARLHSSGMQALERARAGMTLPRPALLALAELEDDLEDQSTGNANSEEGILASLAFPATRGKAILLRDHSHASGNFVHDQWMAWAFTSVIAFILIVGLAGIPAALQFGGEAWEIVALPLGSVAFLFWILWHQREQSN